MHPFNAMMAARMLTAVGKSNGLESETIPFGSLWWSIYAGVSCFLVLFAGIMSGLTLGLMSLGLVDLEILQRSGSPKEKKQSGSFIQSNRIAFSDSDSFNCFFFCFSCDFSGCSETASASSDTSLVQCSCYGGILI